MNKIYEDSINKELQQIEHMKVIITLFSDLNDGVRVLFLLECQTIHLEYPYLANTSTLNQR